MSGWFLVEMPNEGALKVGDNIEIASTKAENCWGVCIAPGGLRLRMIGPPPSGPYVATYARSGQTGTVKKVASTQIYLPDGGDKPVPGAEIEF